MDAKTLQRISEGAAQVESQITEGLERLLGRPLTSMQDLEGMGTIPITADQAIGFAIATSMRVAMLAAALRGLTEELLRDPTLTE